MGEISMGIFDKLFGKDKKNQDTTKDIYELLFCDNFSLYKNMQNIYPDIFSNNTNKNILEKLATDTNNESRIRVLAYRKLATMGLNYDKKDILGVIFEYPMPKGLDVLAVYSDGNARYINHSGKILIWEGISPTEDVKNIFCEADIITRQIGPWKDQRLPPPDTGNVRLTFLVNGEIYFGQGPAEFMLEEPLAKNIITHLTNFLNYIVRKSQNK